jgi:hypothetical protein
MNKNGIEKELEQQNVTVMGLPRPVDSDNNINNIVAETT